MHYELSETLTRLIESIDGPVPDGIVITGLEIDFPLEVASATRNGAIVFYGSAPHSRWKAGFLPEVHLAHLTVVSEPHSSNPSHPPVQEP